MPFPRVAPGPFRADQIREGDPYELSDGHAIYCAPAGHRHGGTQNAGASALASDPAVDGRVSIDVGIAFNDNKNLRAPDLIVTDNTPLQPGWLRTVPPLAVEYADVGQDEAELATKISELLTLGVRYIWVVRLNGPLRVEVHVRGEPVRILRADDTLTAPGVLQNPLPVRALVDPATSRAVTLHNLLQQHGYTSIAEIQAESHATGKLEGKLEATAASILTLLQLREIAVPPAAAATIRASHDLEQLERWLRRALTVTTADELLA
ncbi:MAG: Uma2 family endonuclease [Nannocystis sp.]|uniref:Uma2 family endonuclease n=1 Tax=Nannocystis sp. TaxID=1962667 RepID=UPI00242819E8|nr:Uma2 family endonuclease [Nannocystis sp.]MBK9756781.1 Uma2 family endonuclease [Nannocystis sp.]